MKKLITIILIFLTLSCGTLSNTNRWYEIGSDNVQVELCRDTVSYQQLDSICMYHNIRPSQDDWISMRYYNTENELMNQYVYVEYPNILYTITNFGDDRYIFVVRELNY